MRQDPLRSRDERPSPGPLLIRALILARSTLDLLVALSVQNHFVFDTALLRRNIVTSTDNIQIAVTRVDTPY